MNEWANALVEAHRDPGLTHWLERVVAGDTQAKGWLYDSYATRLYRRLRRRYAERGIDAEEVLQDAFVLFFQHDSRVLARFLERSSPAERTSSRFEEYLWDVACGIASNRRRSARRHRDLSLADADSRPDPFDTERQHVDRDVLRRLAACLARSGSRVYLYYKLRFVDGLTPDEIARVTGWSRRATYKLRLVLLHAVDRCAEHLGLS